MRKYKDVGKRILVLVLSVCMIAGVLPAIPAEAAERMQMVQLQPEMIPILIPDRRLSRQLRSRLMEKL